MAVAAGAADVDRAGGGVDRDQPLAHRLRGGGDFNHRFAAVGERDQKLGDLLVGRAAVEHRREGARRLVVPQQLRGVGERAEAAHAACRSPTGNPAIFRKLASIA